MPLRLLVIACLFLASCASSAPSTGSLPPAAATAGLASGVWLRPAPAPRGAWAVLLPGASGLTVFDDSHHYFDAASKLNAMGVDVLVVDYRRAYHAAANAPSGETGEKIAWVTGEVIRWAREQGHIRSANGTLVAWSLGAEGLWQLLPHESARAELGIRRAIGFYPSNEEGVPVGNSVRLLLLVGESDDVTPLADLRSTLNGAPSAVSLVTYPGAHHGFDIESLRTPRVVSLIPIIGPKGTFGYDAAAAKDAWQRVSAFLAE